MKNNYVVINPENNQIIEENNDWLDLEKKYVNSDKKVLIFRKDTLSFLNERKEIISRFKRDAYNYIDSFSETNTIVICTKKGEILTGKRIRIFQTGARAYLVNIWTEDEDANTVSHHDINFKDIIHVDVVAPRRFPQLGNVRTVLQYMFKKLREDYEFSYELHEAETIAFETINRITI